MNNTLITGYNNMDLDGAASAFAYAEFLNKNNIKAKAGIFRHIHQEAEFVFNEFKIPKLKDANQINYDKVILVDASDAQWISNKVKPEQVIEIIDHRSIHEAGKFINAKIKIELVGAASTLIAEKFYENKIPISIESATLLYSAIISNTINFKANVTTDKDKKIAEWLQTKFTIPNNFIHRMFSYKSEFKKSIYEEMIEFLGINPSLSSRVGIAQLEIIEVEKFIKNNLAEIKTSLNKIKKEKNLEYIFLTCIDIEKGFNKFVAVDDKSKKLVEKIFNLKFQTDNTIRRDGVIMRKQIWPLILTKGKKLLQ